MYTKYFFFVRCLLICFAICPFFQTTNFPRALDELNPIATIYSSSIFCGHIEINHSAWVGNLLLHSCIFAFAACCCLFVCFGLGYKNRKMAFVIDEFIGMTTLR